jgi:hypothetical protein
MIHSVNKLFWLVTIIFSNKEIITGFIVHVTYQYDSHARELQIIHLYIHSDGWTSLFAREVSDSSSVRRRPTSRLSTDYYFIHERGITEEVRIIYLDHTFSESWFEFIFTYIIYFEVSRITKLSAICILRGRRIAPTMAALSFYGIIMVKPMVSMLPRLPRRLAQGGSKCSNGTEGIHPRVYPS